MPFIPDKKSSFVPDDEELKKRKKTGFIPDVDQSLVEPSLAEQAVGGIRKGFDMTKKALLLPKEKITDVSVYGRELKESALENIEEFGTKPDTQYPRLRAGAAAVASTALDYAPTTPEEALEFVAVGKGLNIAGKALKPLVTKYFPKTAQLLLKERNLVAPEVKARAQAKFNKFAEELKNRFETTEGRAIKRRGGRSKEELSEIIRKSNEDFIKKADNEMAQEIKAIEFKPQEPVELPQAQNRITTGAGTSGELPVKQILPSEAGIGKPLTPEVKPTADQPLIQEARKYKTAEEFVKDYDSTKIDDNLVNEAFNKRKITFPNSGKRPLFIDQFEKNILQPDGTYKFVPIEKYKIEDGNKFRNWETKDEVLKSIKVKLLNNESSNKKNVIEEFINSQDVNSKILYHGTGSSFEKFKLGSKIRTGEGHNSFGYGVYLTDTPEIGIKYSETIGDKKDLLRERKFNNYMTESGDVYSGKTIIEIAKENDETPDFDSFIEVVKNKKGEWVEGSRKSKDKKISKTIYTVSLNPKEYLFIDWENHVNSKTKSKLGISDNEITGEDLYKKLVKDHGSQQEASEFLYSKGIDGIEYSAGTLSKTNSLGKNYVMFNPSDIKINKKDIGRVFSLRESQLTDIWNKAQEQPTVPRETPLEGTGDVKKSGLSKTLQEQTIDKNIEVDFGELPQYKARPMKSKEAIDFVNNNPELSKEIVNGTKHPPEGLLVGEVYSAMKIKAIDNLDVSTILELSKAKANDIATAYGREIKAFDSRVEYDPVRAIKDISKVREEVATKRSIDKDLIKNRKNLSRNINSEIKRASPKIKTWEDFIISIRC